jgi:hypothetical protein
VAVAMCCLETIDAIATVLSCKRALCGSTHAHPNPSTHTPLCSSTACTFSSSLSSHVLHLLAHNLKHVAAAHVGLEGVKPVVTGHKVHIRVPGLVIVTGPEYIEETEEDMPCVTCC